MSLRHKILTDKKYKGYLNYFVLPDTRQIKTYHFSNLFGDEAVELENKFKNSKQHSFVGSVVVRDFENEKY